mmetsp:Transcript_24292/g.58629  ORF Transcript_24292/g.58629 Transcript_24292/m.58629 type:complete len:301 (-) Transcript_24292:339-1241(-)
MMNQSFAKNIYYFPKINRQETEALLSSRTLGTFVFRSSSSKAGGIVLSIKQRRLVLHILLRYSDRQQRFVFVSKGSMKCSLENKSFKSLTEIINDLKSRRLVGSGIVNPDHVPKNIPESPQTEIKGRKSSVLGEQGKHVLQEIFGASKDLKDYECMLRVFIMDKCLTPEELDQLAEYRRIHSISTQSHTETMISLGISKLTWDEYVETGKKVLNKKPGYDVKQSAPPSKRGVRTWSEKEVILWLETVAEEFNIKAKSIERMKGQDLTGDALLDLDRPMMMALGLTLGQANAIFKATNTVR